MIKFFSSRLSAKKAHLVDASTVRRFGGSAVRLISPSKPEITAEAQPKFFGLNLFELPVITVRPQR
ncbi:hypothetical protein [Microcystis wesenbergii]|uniref:Transposase n=1 Tax=Microcystis wesenbergii NRERC-220 TaxID=3068991 RepID=A0ABU3HN90_9CHRO|nr:hypothetical protein [Microcystis wesenbergii]MDT3676015.1 hypothetical protein [Microcystis wesenbergii NRERC-220]